MSLFWIDSPEQQYYTLREPHDFLQLFCLFYQETLVWGCMGLVCMKGQHKGYTSLTYAKSNLWRLQQPGWPITVARDHQRWPSRVTFSFTNCRAKRWCRICYNDSGSATMALHHLRVPNQSRDPPEFGSSRVRAALWCQCQYVLMLRRIQSTYPLLLCWPRGPLLYFKNSKVPLKEHVSGYHSGGICHSKNILCMVC